MGFEEYQNILKEGFESCADCHSENHSCFVSSKDLSITDPICFFVGRPRGLEYMHRERDQSPLGPDKNPRTSNVLTVYLCGTTA